MTTPDRTRSSVLGRIPVRRVEIVQPLALAPERAEDGLDAGPAQGGKRLPAGVPQARPAKQPIGREHEAGCFQVLGLLQRHRDHQPGVKVVHRLRVGERVGDDEHARLHPGRADCPDHVGPPRRLLHVELEARAGLAAPLQHVGKPRHPLVQDGAVRAPELQRADLGPGVVLHGAAAGRRAVQRVVVHQHQHAVARGRDVDLEEGHAGREAGGEARHRVLGGRRVGLAPVRRDDRQVALAEAVEPGSEVGRAPVPGRAAPRRQQRRSADPGRDGQPSEHAREVCHGFASDGNGPLQDAAPEPVAARRCSTVRRIPSS